MKTNTLTEELLERINAYWRALTGCGWKPYFVEGDDPQTMHQLMAATLDQAVEDIRQIQNNARENNDITRPRFPMIVLKSPKGWTGPKFVDDLQNEGTLRVHHVPIILDAEHPDHVEQLESWMKSYRPQELFDETGCLMPELFELAPKRDRRMGGNPHANGGILMRDLRMPDFHTHAVNVPSPGAVEWWLSCYRNPQMQVRPKDEVFYMEYEKPENLEKLGAELVK